MQDKIKRLEEELNEIDKPSATQDPSINVGQVTGEEVVVGTKITYYVNNKNQYILPSEPSPPPPTA